MGGEGLKKKSVEQVDDFVKYGEATIDDKNQMWVDGPDEPNQADDSRLGFRVSISYVQRVQEEAHIAVRNDIWDALLYEMGVPGERATINEGGLPVWITNYQAGFWI
jgi:hypothetical protein